MLRSQLPQVCVGRMLACALTLVAACGPVAAQIAPAPVTDALLAKVAGLCFEIDTVRTRVVKFFPAVTLTEGICRGPHGDTLSTIVASDGSGLVYLLDSPTSFEFLRRRHPLGSELAKAAPETIVAYSREALLLMGKLPSDARIARNADDVPASVTRRLNHSHREIPGTKVEPARGPAFPVVISAYTDDTVYVFRLLVVKATGSVVITMDSPQP